MESFFDMYAANLLTNNIVLYTIELSFEFELLKYGPVGKLWLWAICVEFFKDTSNS